MNSFAGIEGSTLNWKPIKANQYELISESEPLATLRLKSAFVSSALGATAEDEWSLKSKGFFHAHLVVRQGEQGMPVATFRRDGRRQRRLDLADQRTFLWRQTKLQRGEWGFYTLSGEPIVRIKPKTKALRYQADVLVTPEYRELPELPLLCIVGWYWMVLQHRTRLAAAAAAGAGGS